MQDKRSPLNMNLTAINKLYQLISWKQNKKNHTECIVTI
jgi:hypothetical protein